MERQYLGGNSDGVPGMIGKGLPPWLKGFIVRSWLCIGYPCCCYEGQTGDCNCSHCADGMACTYEVEFADVVDDDCGTECLDFNTTTYEVTEDFSCALSDAPMSPATCGYTALTMAIYAASFWLRVEKHVFGPEKYADSEFRKTTSGPHDCLVAHDLPWENDTAVYPTPDDLCDFTSATATITPI